MQGFFYAVRLMSSADIVIVHARYSWASLTVNAVLGEQWGDVSTSHHAIMTSPTVCQCMAGLSSAGAQSLSNILVQQTRCYRCANMSATDVNRKIGRL